MIQRALAATLRSVAKQYPVVMVTGPRQSGKTTLCRAAFPRKAYVSLEPLDTRRYAQEDPRGFLAEHAAGAIIDEAQRVPELLSYLQDDVDRRATPGRFILTGSQQLGLASAVAQSLAGRTAVLTLLPPSVDELRQFESAPRELFATLWSGAYPRIFDRGVPPARWLSDYVTTYIQRDVRAVHAVGDLAAFTTFLRLCAGRTAQEVNLSSLGADAGISQPTARAWLSILEASFLCFRLPPWHVNVTKQAVKAAKLHFFDTGLVCHLLGIQTAKQLRHHPLRGAIFETWVASEVWKARAHAGKTPDLFHFRDSKGLEVDLLLRGGNDFALIESKSGATLAQETFGLIDKAMTAIAPSFEGRKGRAFVVYGGEEAQVRSRATVLPWNTVAKTRWGKM